MRYEHVAAEGDYHPATWADEAFRERLWDEIRDKAAGIAAARGHVLEEGHRETRTVTRSHDGSVRLRLEGWALVPENTTGR